jgi:hypothetical protein
MEKDIARDHETARLLLAKGEKEKARRALRLKQYKVKILENTQNQLDNLVQLVSQPHALLTYI